MKPFFILILLLSTSLMAVDITDDIRVRGFATLDATINTSDTTISNLPSGNSYTLNENQVAYDYSSFGAQFEYDVTNSVDFMAQGIYSKRYDKELENNYYKATLEWLLVGYSFGDDYKLRLGKMKVPFMKATENRYINYSFLWTRPQLANKGTNGFDDMYGADLLKRTYIKDIDLEFQLTVGQAYHSSSPDEGKYLYNFSALASYEASWLRLSFGQNIFDHYARDNALLAKDVTLTFVSAETELHIGNVILFGGYALNANSEIPDQKFGYLSLAYEIDRLTPYLLYSRTKVDNIPNKGPGSPPNAPAGRDSHLIEEHHAIGFRYDLYSNFALKSQYDVQKINTYNPLKESSSDADVYTLTLDMVF